MRVCVCVCGRVRICVCCARPKVAPRQTPRAEGRPHPCVATRFLKHVADLGKERQLADAGFRSNQRVFCFFSFFFPRWKTSCRIGLIDPIRQLSFRSYLICLFVFVCFSFFVLKFHSPNRLFVVTRRLGAAQTIVGSSCDSFAHAGYVMLQPRYTGSRHTISFSGHFHNTTTGKYTVVQPRHLHTQPPHNKTICNGRKGQIYTHNTTCYETVQLTNLHRQPTPNTTTCAIVRRTQATKQNAMHS
jgi:hypothetical protein